MIYIISILLISFQLFEVLPNSEPERDRVKQIVRQMNDSYSNIEYLKINMNYSFYKSHKGNNLLYKKEGLILKHGKLFYKKFMNSEIVVNEDFRIAIDHDSKKILVDSLSNYWEQFELIDENIEVALKAANQFEVHEDQSGQSRVSFYFKNNSYDRMDILYSDHTYLIEKIIYYFDNEVSYPDNLPANTRLDITFRSTIGTPISKNIFSTNKYLKIYKNSLEPVSRFSSYEVRLLF